MPTWDDVVAIGTGLPGVEVTTSYGTPALKVAGGFMCRLRTDPNALKVYSDWLKISEAKAKRTRDDFFPRASVEPDKIVGLDTIVKDAVSLKYTATELTKAQLDELIQIPPR